MRSLALLLLTIAPLLVAAILGVFGRPLRHWIAQELGKSNSIQTLWGFFFHGTAILLAMVSLTVIYRVARPKESSLRNVLPGAMVATLLWWIADIGFGFYVRRVPYNVVYGGLAAVIGLLIWMQLSTVIIFLGAAWNAELADARRKESRAMSEKIVARRMLRRLQSRRATRARVLLDGQMVEVAVIEDRWYSPGSTYFRVLLRNGERYVLRRQEAQDVWTIEAFRAANPLTWVTSRTLTQK